MARVVSIAARRALRAARTQVRDAPARPARGALSSRGRPETAARGEVRVAVSGLLMLRSDDGPGFRGSVPGRCTRTRRGRHRAGGAARGTGAYAPDPVSPCGTAIPSASPRARRPSRRARADACSIRRARRSARPTWTHQAPTWTGIRRRSAPGRADAVEHERCRTCPTDRPRRRALSRAGASPSGGQARARQVQEQS